MHCTTITRGGVASLAVAACLAWGAIPAAADALFTGDPLVDNWTFMGESTQAGIWVRDNHASFPTAPTYDFNVYRTRYVADGDQWLGLGVDVLGTLTSDSATNGVNKLGTSTATYRPATTVGGTDGIGSTSAGGTGTVLFRVRASGSAPDLYWYSADGTSVNLISTYGSVIAADYKYVVQTEIVGGTPYLRSYEVLLNVTALQRDTGIAYWPTANAKSVIALQKGSSQYNDAYVGAAHSPEPSTLALMGTGLTVPMLWRRRRRRPRF